MLDQVKYLSLRTSSRERPLLRSCRWSCREGAAARQEAEDRPRSRRRRADRIAHLSLSTLAKQTEWAIMPSTNRVGPGADQLLAGGRVGHRQVLHTWPSPWTGTRRRLEGHRRRSVSHRLSFARWLRRRSNTADFGDVLWVDHGDPSPPPGRNNRPVTAHHFGAGQQVGHLELGRSSRVCSPLPRRCSSMRRLATRNGTVTRPLPERDCLTQGRGRRPRRRRCRFSPVNLQRVVGTSPGRVGRRSPWPPVQISIGVVATASSTRGRAARGPCRGRGRRRAREPLGRAAGGPGGGRPNRWHR